VALCLVIFSFWNQSVRVFSFSRERADYDHPTCTLVKRQVCRHIQQISVNYSGLAENSYSVASSQSTDNPAGIEHRADGVNLEHGKPVVPSVHFKRCIRRFRKLASVPAKNEKVTTRFAGKGLKTKPNARASTVPEEETLPHLVADRNLQRCSVCGYPFPADVRPSMAVAFAEHLMKGHLPGQTHENVSRSSPPNRTKVIA